MVSMEYISSEVASAGASRAIILSRSPPSPSSLSLCLLCLLRVDEIVFVREAAKKRVTLSSFSYLLFPLLLLCVLLFNDDERKARE